MSECVVRMEMPHGCHDCKLRNMVGNCPIPIFDGQDEKKIWTLAECFERPPWCPIICSLPEGHGRLVDISPLDVIAFRDKDDSFCAGALSVCERIDKLPTIVPADTAERSET